VLKIPSTSCAWSAPDVGGGFGVKQFHYGEEAVITWAAKRVGRPSNGCATARKAISPTATAATT
jgi:CO/xanthine dehydrogenase Mo-binding subunit